MAVEAIRATGLHPRVAGKAGGSEEAPTRKGLLRAGAAAAVVGQVMLLASSAFHPAGEHPADHAKVFAEYAQDGSWITTHLVQWIGGVLITWKRPSTVLWSV
jgi:hypothetical protein